MRGDPDSCGVWAPCLSHADGRFWLIYTDVKRLDGNFKDAHNYLVTAPAITGPWSDPVYLNSSGFDPSLFHDDDGRKWLLNMQWKHLTDSVGGAPEHPAFDGILAQEYDPVAPPPDRPDPQHLRRLAARARRGAAPLQARRLVLPDHRRGRHRLRPRGDDGALAQPRRPLRAASRHLPPHLQGRARRRPAARRPRPDRRDAGRARSTTPTSAAARCPALRRSPLGRETALQKCVWGDDGWLRLEHGGLVPALEVPAPPGARRARARRARSSTASTARAARRSSSGCAPPTPSASSP